MAGAVCGLLSVIAYGIYEPATSYDGIEQYTRYLIYPTTGALSPVDGGLTNLWVLVSALAGSGAVTILGSIMIPKESIVSSEEE